MWWWIIALAFAAPHEIARAEGAIRGIAVHGSDVAVAAEGAGILVDRATGGVLTVTGAADGVVISPDGRLALFYGLRLGAVFVDMTTGRRVQNIQIAGGISAAAWAPDRAAVALATRWGVMVVDGVSLAISQKHDLRDRPRAVAFEKKTLVIADLGATLAQIDLLDSKIVRSAADPLPAPAIAACVASSQGTVRVVGCEDGVILELEPEDTWPQP